MRFKPGQLIEAVRRLRRDGAIGDFAVLKADALGARARPAAEARLDAVRGYLPPIDLDGLARLPDGSFGRAYARHMAENGLQPLRVSPDLDAVVRRNTFAVRYAVTHDMFHLLLGFDTSRAGEMGVLAFAAAQNYARASKVSLVIAAILYPILAPRQTRRIFANLRAGRSMGRRAPFLLGERLEEHWAEPLVELRARYGLTEDA